MPTAPTRERSGGADRDGRGAARSGQATHPTTETTETTETSEAREAREASEKRRGEGEANA
ncbi:hypothetical protein [Streptomyces xinghaiensis]|uniref:hypothetical protein n=1 Tax=Streptomyces xinghaiensis TaxID=1038928 RepID=UPI0034138100